MVIHNQTTGGGQAGPFASLWRPYSLAEELAFCAQQYGERTAVVEKSRSVSYAELHRRVESLAAGLRDQGVAAGMCAILQFPNSLEYVLAAFACFRLGVIPVLTIPAYREADLDMLCAAAKPVLYFAPRRYAGYDYAPLVARMRQRHPSLRLFVSDEPLPDSIPLDALQGDPKDLPYPDPASTALVLLTGGTTNAPKMIPKTHQQYFTHALLSAKRCKVSGDTVYMVALPIAHHFCMACPGILGAFAHGAKVVLASSPSFDEVFPLIEREKVSLMASVPPLLRAWTEAKKWDDSDLSSLKLVQVGGSPLDADTVEEARECMGCAIQQAYGFTEGLVCYTDPDDPTFLEDTRVQGDSLFAEDDLRIVDEKGQDVAKGEKGELIVKGPCILAAYFRNDEVTAQMLTPEGYCRSGDFAEWTETGRLRVLGRLKDEINRGGEKISAVEMENHLRACPGIADAAVVGVPDRLLGERQCAWILSPEGKKSPSLAEVHSFLRERGLAPFKLPDQVEYVDKWPLTAVGKLNKRALLAMAVESAGK